MLQCLHRRYCLAQGVDVFSKDFLVIPIHDALHWTLAIVAHPGLLPAAAVAAANAAAEAAAGSSALSLSLIHNVRCRRKERGNVW